MVPIELIIVGVTLILGSAIWVFSDSLQVGREYEGAPSMRDAAAWALGVLVLWIVFFPWYLYAKQVRIQRALVERAEGRRSPGSDKERAPRAAAIPKKSAAPYIAFAVLGLIAIGGALWVGYNRLYLTSCDDQKVVDTVKSLLGKRSNEFLKLANAQWGFEVKGIYNISFNGETRSRQCRMTLVIMPPAPALSDLVAQKRAKLGLNVPALQAVAQWDNSPNQAEFKAGKIEGELNYSITRELQNQQWYVEIRNDDHGLDALSNYVQMLAVLLAAPIQEEPTSAVIAAPGGVAPSSRLVQVEKVEMCGDEALCVQAQTGEVFRTNAAALAQDQLNDLNRAAQTHSARCLGEVSGAGQELFFERVLPVSGC